MSESCKDELSNAFILHTKLSFYDLLWLWVFEWFLMYESFMSSRLWIIEVFILGIFGIVCFSIIMRIIIFAYKQTLQKMNQLLFVLCNLSIHFSDIQIFYWCSSSLPCDTNMDELALSESKHTSHPFSDEDVNDVHTRYSVFYSLLKIPM